MVTVTLLLVAAQHASMRVAGLVVAGYTVAQAVSGPLRGRLAAPLAGLCLGPTLATLFGAAAAAAPHGRGTETQAWVNSIMNGAAAGAAIAAFAAERPVLALGLASAMAAVAALSAVRGPLRRG
jgi:hypothetical protein